jgi:hypothetical protein
LKSTKEDEVDELLEILKVFNVKVTEKLMAVTSDPGASLGVNIESELDGLPYTVRYSFDTCLSHGYLFTFLRFYTYDGLAANIALQNPLPTSLSGSLFQPLAGFSIPLPLGGNILPTLIRT